MRVEHIGDCTLYRGDCREILPMGGDDVRPELADVDAVVTDPPYGIREASGKNANRGGPIGGKSSGGRIVAAKDYGNFTWDNATADNEIAAAVAMAKWSIIFGGNYYNLPPTSCWLVWDKLNSGDFADCELAWTNLPKAVRRIQFMWNGCFRRERHIQREHPTQKPVDVMKWCIEHIPPPNNTILDPFMGSGTTGVACVKLGRKFIGIEINETYFDIACRRIEEAYKQPDLFVQVERPDPPEQLDLITCTTSS